MMPVCTISMAVFALVGIDQIPTAHRQYRPPIERPADPLLKEAFIEVMTQSAGWELLPQRAVISPAGREDYTEVLQWRKAGVEIYLRFTQYASADEASLALHWDLQVLSIGFPQLKGFADEAYGREWDPLPRFFRRGAYVLQVHAFMPPLEVSEMTLGAPSDSPAGQKVGRLYGRERPTTDYAALFLAAMDRHMGAKSPK
jgi:hypothetical protein